MAIVKIHKDIMNKLEDRGFEAVWLGYGTNHPENTFRFMNLRNKEVIYSRDCTWLNMTLGEFRKLKKNESVKSKLRFFDDYSTRKTRGMTRAIDAENGELENENDGIIEIDDEGHLEEPQIDLSEVVRVESDDDNQNFDQLVEIDENEENDENMVSREDISEHISGQERDRVTGSVRKVKLGHGGRVQTRSMTKKGTRQNSYHANISDGINLFLVQYEVNLIDSEPNNFEEAWNNKDPIKRENGEVISMKKPKHLKLEKCGIL